MIEQGVLSWMEAILQKGADMNWKTGIFLAVGVAGMGIITASATEPSPRKGLGHGECVRESCENQQRDQVKERQHRNRDADTADAVSRERRRRGHGRGEARGAGSGEGEFRQGKGQGQGWHRDRTGARKPDSK